jgi:hypothetical protein
MASLASCADFDLDSAPLDALSVVQAHPRPDCRIRRHHRHGMHLFDRPWRIEDRRRRAALGAKDSVPAAMRVIVTHIVFAGERVFVVPRALMQRGGIWTATLSVVHAGRHGSLAFDYAQRVAQKEHRSELRSRFFVTKSGWTSRP